MKEKVKKNPYFENEKSFEARDIHIFMGFAKKGSILIGLQTVNKIRSFGVQILFLNKKFIYFVQRELSIDLLIITLLYLYGSDILRMQDILDKCIV